MGSIDLFKDFNEDDDARYGDMDDDDVERDNPNTSDQENKSGEENPVDDEGKQEVDPAIKVKKPKRKLVTLNPEKLKGPRGIIAIDDFFQNIKLKGKGYEKQDLNEVMKRLEHWSHRMFPKYNFDDSLGKIERLGRKKEIALHMTRYRLGQLTQEDDNRVLSDNEDDRMEDTLANELPVDEFEDMLNQQIALSATANRTNNDASVSQLNMSSVSTSTQIHNKPISQDLPLFSQQTQPSQEVSQPKPQLTDEQKARIEENRRKAMAIRAAKMKELEEKRLEEQKLEEPSQSKMQIETDEQKARIEENRRKALAIRAAKLKELEEKRLEEQKLKERSQPTINIEIDDDFC